MSQIIKLENITKSYFAGNVETKVLYGINLEVAQGEFIAVMGPSGAGKSTLLHILGFLDKHTSGNFYFDEKKVNNYDEIARAHIRNEQMGFVFQAFNLLARTSVLENVKLPLLYSQIPFDKWDDLARNAIESVGLSHRIGHDPSQLSGGEKQRVAIARALVCDPPIIFADEPTGNLDSRSGAVVMDIIKGLHKKGKTIVLITHDDHIAKYAERLIHIVDGLVDVDRILADEILSYSDNLPL